ncbi:MAG: hypothetical protein IT254_11845 [Chitinophagaceae bacterium]|nr:hypothetical protein [Bacteroidota bacterium]MCC6259008.1 hypothetical protein [Chitinophagaceae bacterium]MCW5917596.1 hypothetical protein [Ferruginibacter sp.]
MKKFISGILLGVILASGIWYFLIKKQNDDDRRQLRNLISEIQQQQQAKLLSEKILDKQGLKIAGDKTFTIIASSEGCYFFEGPDCRQMIRGSFKEVRDGVEKAKAKFGSALMVIVKETDDAKRGEIMELLNQLDQTGLAPGQFTSLILSNTEKDCIQSLKQ